MSHHDVPASITTGGSRQPSLAHIPGRNGADPGLVLGGDWTVAHADRLAQLIARTPAIPSPDTGNIEIDAHGVDRLDTAGCLMLTRLTDAKGAGQVRVSGLTASQRRLLDVVASHRTDRAAGSATQQQTSRHGPNFPERTVTRIGESVVHLLGLFGAVCIAFARAVRQPSRFRVPAIVHQMDRAGFRAVPVVFLVAFLVGVIIAQQGVVQLSRVGAELFIVDLVGLVVFREIGVLLTAVMLAGRSGSAFTAEIGSMCLREEIDALRVIGLNPIEVLVLPRVIALILVFPALTLVADFAAILGAIFVTEMFTGVTWAMFIERLQEFLRGGIVVAGFVKAPFMALTISLVSCAEGLLVEGSSASLGRRTTIAVVKSLFLVIVLDGIFAVFLTSIGY